MSTNGFLRAAPFILFCALSLTSFSDDPPETFAWRQPIRDGMKEGQLYRIRMTPEIFDGCRAYPSDIRIIDEATNQWPFFIWVPAPAVDIESLRSSLLNQSIADGPERYLRVDIQIEGPKRGGARLRHDRIVVNTAGSQYVRRVDVFGSEDGTDWKRMASGYLIDQKREVQVTSKSILYPVSDFPRLQVRIYPNAENANEELVLRGVAVAATVRKDGESSRVDLAMSEADAKDRRDGVHAVVLDQGAAGRPLASVRVEAAAGEFIRAVRVSGRNDPTNAWRWVAEGSVFRFGDQSRDTIELNDAPYRYYLLEEYHYNDTPLRIDRVTAEAVPRYIVFEAGTGDRPDLFYGSPAAQVPRYDLQRRTKENRILEAPVVELGRPESQEAPVASLAYGSWLAVLGVGIASLVVIFVIVSMIRRNAP